MQSVNIKSILYDVLERIEKIPGLEAKKDVVIDIIDGTNIKDQDKRKMLMVIRYQCPSEYKLTTYLYNAILKYEGLGVI